MEGSESLGRLIRESRLRRGMSLGQLASTIGRSSSSVRRWERDEVAPAIAIMPRLAEALQIDVADLEARRYPQYGEDDSDQHTAGGDRTGSTIEQDAVPSRQPAPDREVERAPVGFFGELWNTVFAQREAWIPWVRGIATAVLLVIMLVILVWAVGGLWDGIKEIWDSFDAETALG
ncbi:MAG: helix-turn-helix transcriptional regulator [Acidimicrobiia bacterium]